MARVLIGTFPTREAAEAAHAALDADTMHRARASAAQAKPAADTTASLESIIANIFSGLAPPPKFTERVHRDRDRGAWTLAIRGLDDERGERARAILAQSGDTDWFDDDAVGAAAASTDAEVALFGPDIALLPNAPSGWREAWTGTASRVRSAGVDPARPRGLIEDAACLSPAGPAKGAAAGASDADAGGPRTRDRSGDVR